MLELVPINAHAGAPDHALIALDALPAVAPTPLGRAAGACGAILSSVDLDTLGGSSGAGVLAAGGELVAVHTDGDCAPDGSGANRAWTADSIVAASTCLEASDLE